MYKQFAIEGIDAYISNSTAKNKIVLTEIASNSSGTTPVMVFTTPYLKAIMGYAREKYNTQVSLSAYIFAFNNWKPLHTYYIFPSKVVAGHKRASADLSARGYCFHDVWKTCCH